MRLIRLHLTCLVAALASFALASLIAPSRAAADVPFETAAREAILVDMTTGRILYEKNADQRMPTASMSKLMTMYMVFEAIRQGRLTLEDRLTVSETAWRKGGSKMFVEVGDEVAVEDLIRGVIIQSGNDATIVLAEALGGTEEAFAAAMTARAQDLGLSRSNFANASGWPNPDHYSTARDLALLAQLIIENFPEFYAIYSETEFTYNGIRQGNRNPLLYRDIGVDGLKTGHTSEAGYGLTASAQRGGQRVVMVVNGLPSVQARADESARLIQWGLTNFDVYDVFAAGDTVAEVPVWVGDKQRIGAVINQDVAVTLSPDERRDLEVFAEVTQPVAAPISTGQALGELVVKSGDREFGRYPLFASEAVAQLGFFGRVQAAVQQIVFGGSS